MAVSFSKDIRPLFTDTDIDHMSFFADLASYDDVKTHATDIMGRLTGKTGRQMPPASTGGPWKPAQIALFQQWITEGCRP